MTCAYCNKPAVTGGLCAAHYTRQRRGLPMDRPVRERREGGGRTVSIHLSDEEHASVLAAASDAQLSTSALARRLLVSALTRSRRKGA